MPPVCLRRCIPGYQLFCNNYLSSLRELFNLSLNCACVDRFIKLNSAIVDHISPALCNPIIPRPRRNNPFCCVTLFAANMLQCIASREENPPKLPLPLGISSPWQRRNMHKIFGKDRACGSRDMRADRQTDIQTNVLNTILLHRCRGRSKYYSSPTLCSTTRNKQIVFRQCIFYAAL